MILATMRETQALHRDDCERILRELEKSEAVILVVYSDFNVLHSGKHNDEVQL